jgi:hypothetical protein
MRFSTLCPLGLLLAGLAAGCAHVESEPQLYYFNHSVLNFDREPLYPRKFEVPPPLERAEPEQVARVDKKTASPVLRGANPLASEPPPRTVAAMPVRRDAEPRVEAHHVARSPEGDGVPVLPAAAIMLDRGPDRRGLDPDFEASLGVGDPDVDRPDEEAPDAAEVGTRPTPPAASGLREEVLAAAKRVVGIKKDFDGASFVAHVLKVNGIEAPVEYGDTYIRDLYKHLKASGLTYDGQAPLPGDLVFFHNSADRNGDGRNNDWYSLCGVVDSVEEDGTVRFVAVVRDEVQELVMNLGRPEVRRDERTSAYLNSFLRTKSMSDAEYTQYLAGELYAGFASVGLP